MALELVEGAVDVVNAYLQAGMGAKLDILDAEYGDFILEDIKEWYTAEQTAIPEYPAIYILGDDTEVVEEGADWMRAKHRLLIVCLATDQDTTRLRQRLYRYIRAIIELLKSGRASLGYSVTFEGISYSPLYGRAGLFMSDSNLIIGVTKYETQ